MPDTLTGYKDAMDSSTIKAAIVAIVTASLPLIKGMFGIDLGLTSDDIAMVATSVVVIIAGIFVVRGRLKATQQIGSPS